MKGICKEKKTLQVLFLWLLSGKWDEVTKKTCVNLAKVTKRIEKKRNQ